MAYKCCLPFLVKRNRKDSNRPYKIYVSTMPCNGYKDDQSLESPVITFKCNINVRFISDKSEPEKCMPRYIADHYSCHEFEHHITNDQLTLRDFISSIFSDTRIIPFPLGNLHWKEREYDKESVPRLMSIDDVLVSLFDVCHRMVRESSRKKLFLIVLVRKHVIVPHDEYLAMVKARKRQEVLSGVKRLHARGRNLSQWELMDNELREARFWRRETLKLVRKHAKRESTEEALEVKFVPAAETAIQALEKVTPKHSEQNQRHHGFVKCCVPFLAKKTKYLEEKCSVCIEKMPTGPQLTCLPCSHVFHGVCIVRWLKISHTCPVCQFKLPTT